MSKKCQQIKLDGERYDVGQTSQCIRDMIAQLQDIDWLMVEKQNRVATLRRAKHAYLVDLRDEIVRKKSGVDLSALLDGE